MSEIQVFNYLVIMDKSTVMSSNTLLIDRDSLWLHKQLIAQSMKKARELPRTTLAKNVSYLMSKHKHSEAYVAEKAGVSQKTVNNMKTGRTSVQLDKVDAVAAVYGLTSWQLIMPSLVEELEGGSTVGKIYVDYIKSSPDGRKHISMVAEREATYSAGSNSN